MRNGMFVRVLFVVAALYDGILGVLFLFAPAALYERMAVPPPNHFGYVHFPAALLLVFTIMFAAIARDPAKNRNLIPYGMLLKVCYSGVVFWHWFTAGIPDMWKSFAIMDVAFLALFILAYRWIGQKCSMELPI